MDRQDAIKVLEWLHDNDYVSQYMKSEVREATEMAIDTLKLMEKYDAAWENIDTASEKGQEVEIHRCARVYRIRRVAT